MSLTIEYCEAIPIIFIKSHPIKSIKASQKKLTKAKMLRAKYSVVFTINSMPSASRNAMKVTAKAIENPPKKANIIGGIAIVMISYWMKSYKRYVKKMKERIEQRQEQAEINRLKREKEQISKIFKEYKNLPTPKYQKGKPEYGNEEQVIDYFNDLRQKGKTDMEIIESLVDVGWNQNLVHRIYQKYQSNNPFSEKL